MSSIQSSKTESMNDPTLARFTSVSDYENHQKSQILNVILSISGVATILMGISNIRQEAFNASISLFGFSLICVLGLVLNRRNHLLFASLLVMGTSYFVIFYNLAIGGGLRDTAVAALPIITLIAGLLFGKRATLIFTAVTIVAVLVFNTLDWNGVISPAFSVGQASLIILSLILVIMGVTQNSIMAFWQRNLNWVRQSEQQVRDAYDKTLEGWARALEFRDRETEGHSRRVVELSLKLAEKLNITDPQQLTQIRQGALLHDIGKMAIPDEVLLKPGPLTKEEWALIETHPLLAKQLLEDLPFLSAVLDIPLHHHEHWDGSGYPAGLAGEEIPIQARLFSIIDNWDALSSERPYRDPWERKEIIDYLQKNAGKKFDPEIVAAFLEMVEKDLEK